jgi:dihydroorotate dehydrogenase electron transfer subunit
LSATAGRASAVPASRTTAPLGRRQVVVAGREQYGPYVVLRCPDPDGPRPQAGQFYMLSSSERWGGGDGERPFLPRAFSVLRVLDGPDAIELHFLIEDVGPGTRRLCELRGGDGLTLVGPLGQGFTTPRDDRRPLLVGGGVGIAPLAIWQDELDTGAPALLGFRDGGRAQGAALLTGVRVATDDGAAGHHGPVTELLEQELARDPEGWEVYACGPPGMLEAVRSICAQNKVPAQLALEAGMACGFGACFGCVVPTRDGYVRLCLEGPVLDADRLDTVVFAGAGH